MNQPRSALAAALLGLAAAAPLAGAASAQEADPEDMVNAVPASYATAPYFAVHTFYFTNAQVERQPARWIGGE
jgi:hypothetical protein